jgi:hypothetical protein
VTKTWKHFLLDLVVDFAESVGENVGREDGDHHVGLALDQPDRGGRTSSALNSAAPRKSEAPWLEGS